MPVVITNCIGSAEVSHPARLEQRNQPRLMLAGDSHGSGNGQWEWAPHTDGAVENLIDPPEVGAAEGRQAVQKQFVQAAALIHAPHLYVPAVVCRLMLGFHVFS